MEHEGERADRLTEFNRYRGLLFSIAYRMTGSVADAEDIVQEAFLRWHGAAETEVHSTRAFLVTIVSRLAINHLQSARVQREEYFGQWLPEPVATEDGNPFAMARVDESLSMAFLVLLERLTPVERAVFLLREVFEYDYAEVARAVGKDEANCRQILRRAREHVAEMRPRFKASPEQRERLLEKFLQATGSGKLDRLVALLASDAVLHTDGGGRAPSLPNLVAGADRVARAILGGLEKLVPGTPVNRMTQINGELAVVSYVEGRPFAVLTLDVADEKITNVYVVTNPAKLAHLSALAEQPE